MKMLGRKNRKGFTLIEIIAVLVILGILAAVAIPRYLDLQADARDKSAQSAIAEIKARLSLAYGQLLLSGNGVEPTIAAVNTAVNTNVGTDYVVTKTAGNADIAIVVTVASGGNVNVSDTWVMP